MIHLFKTHLLLTLYHSITRYFVSSSEATLPPMHVSEDVLREQHRENQHRDEQRIHALYGIPLFYCPRGHPYTTEQGRYTCLLCGYSPPSRQDGQEKPDPFQLHHEWLEQKRATRSLVNHKIDQAIMPSIDTAILDLGTLTSQEMAALYQSDVTRQETRSEIPALEEQMIVEDEGWLNSTPVLPVDVFDKDATMSVPSIMKLRHAS